METDSDETPGRGANLHRERERERSGCGHMVAWVQVLQRELRDNSVSTMWHI